MNRLRFRVWDKESKIIRNVASINFAAKIITCDWKRNEDESCTEMYDKHLFDGEYELLQSTGLQDKNGKTIYEGDIIDKGYYNLSIEKRIGYVTFGVGGDSDGYLHGEWAGWITNNGDSLLDVHEHCTILGNKFTHQHLLEEE